MRKPGAYEMERLGTGEVGYMVCGVKNVLDARVGDTITNAKERERSDPSSFLVRKVLWPIPKVKIVHVVAVAATPMQGRCSIPCIDASLLDRVFCFGLDFYRG